MSINLGKVQFAKIIPQDIKTSYAVISLNYDTVLESMANYMLSNKLNASDEIAFQKNNFQIVNTTPLLKLHGSVENGEIIEPTSTKSLHSDQLEIWKQATKELSEARQIRFIGYSMPDNDAYLRYFLKAALMNNDHLSQIDVICLDNNNRTEKSYRDFIDFRNLRYMNADVSSYLEKFTRVNLSGNSFHIDIERLHEKFMSLNP